MKKPWVHLLPSLRQNVLSFNLVLDPHILDLQASSILFFSVLPSPHSSPLLLSLLNWLPITLCNSPDGREEFAQLLLLSKDVSTKKRSWFQYAIFRPRTQDTGRGEGRSAERWDTKMRMLIFPAATTPLSFSAIMPFYFLPCSQSPWPHLFLFPFLPVPWERTEKTRPYVSLYTISRLLVHPESLSNHFIYIIRHNRPLETS